MTSIHESHPLRHFGRCRRELDTQQDHLLSISTWDAHASRLVKVLKMLMVFSVFVVIRQAEANVLSGNAR